MSWLNVDFIYCLILLVLVGVIIFQQITHRKTVVQLIDRIMAKNYGEIVQGEVLIKPSNDVVSKQPVGEAIQVDSDVDLLNKIL